MSLIIEIIKDTFIFFIAIVVLIGVHEFGHFIVARLCGVKVLRFSLGFGPVLFSFTGKDGCQYAFSLIPLGGYVKMLDTREGDVKNEELKYEFNSQPVLSRLAIVAAGPIFNILLAIVLFYFMFLLGVSSVKPYVTNLEQDKAAYIAGMRNNDLIMNIDGVDIIDLEEATYELVEHIGKDSVPMRVRHSNGDVQDIDVSIKGWTIDRSQKGKIFEQLGFSLKLYDITTRIAQIIKDSPASETTLKVGDEIFMVNDKELTSWNSFVNLISENKDSILNLKVKRYDLLEKDLLDSKTDLTNAAYEVLDISVKPKNINGRYIVGISPVVGPLDEDAKFVRQYGLLESIPKSFEKLYSVCKLTVVSIYRLIDGNIPINNISGPISIAKAAGTTFSIGMQTFLSFLGLISVNLGIMNLLPLPILDGGHIMFYTYEAIFRRKMSDNIIRWLTYFGLFVLLLLMLFAIYNDLVFDGF